MGQGMSRLQAVNEICRSVSEWRASALDSTGSWPTKVYGSSIQGEAEHILDRICQEVLTRGTIDNTLRYQTVTPTGGGSSFEYTFASPFANALRVVGCGADEHRTFSIVGTKLFDVNRGTTVFTTATPLNLHIIIDRDFDDLSPEVKIEVVKEAKLHFQRYWGEEHAKDIQISQERDIARAAKGEPLVTPKSPPINKLDAIGPFGPALAAQPRGGGGQG